MKKYIKNINWKNVGWRTLQLFFVFVLNSFGIAMLIIMSIYGGGNQNLFFQEGGVKFAWWVYLIEAIGALSSILFIKFLYIQKREDKRVEKQTKELKNEDKFKNL